LEYENPKIPEGINTTDEHPLKGFLILLVATAVLLLILSFALAFSGSWMAGRIPYATEAKMIEKVSFEMSGKSESSDPSQTMLVETYLQKQVDQLASYMDLPAEMQLTANYYDADVVNAFATLGGNLVFYRGLLESLPNENALSMLIAHEIAHVKLRHPIKSLGRGMAVSIGLSMVTGNTDGVQLLGNSGLYTMLHFSRRMERASDAEALSAVYRRYGHLNGARSLFEAIQAERDGDEPAEFFSSHPLDQDRLAAIEEIAKVNGWPVSGQITEIPDFWTVKNAE